MRSMLLLLFCLTFWTSVRGQDLPPFELTPEWLQKIESLVPPGPTDATPAIAHILVFSLHTGYEHWAIPHTQAVVQILVEHSGTARVKTSKDIALFEAEKLSQFDAIVLNNTCPRRDFRDLFYDVFRKRSDMPESARQYEASRLEQNLVRYVAEGGGLVLLHGGTTIQNNSAAFSRMIGGSFDFHPPQQPVAVQLCEPDHPLVRGFQGKGIKIIDEPYFFKNAYPDKDFRPLLWMDTSDLVGLPRNFKDTVRYISWIKPFGAGRVFVCAPTHNAQNFENPALLTFMLEGIRYATGQLEVPDTPIKKP